MKLFHSHNDYWTQCPFYIGIVQGMNMFEVDIIYFCGKLMLSHSWKPFRCMYYGELEEKYLLPMIMYVIANIESELWLYIEYKSGNKKINSLLYNILSRNTHPRLHYTLSALNNTWYQKPRHIQAQQFMDLYKDELGLTWETDLETQYEYERFDLYDKKWWMF
jgi:hypothetical protein